VLQKFIFHLLLLLVVVVVVDVAAVVASKKENYSVPKKGTNKLFFDLD
jgi:hypothetical protein